MNWNYNDAMSQYRNGSSVTNGYSFTAYNTGSTSSSSTTGAIVGSIISVFGEVAATAAMAKAMGANGNGGISNKQISKGVAQIVSQMPAQIATKVSEFNNKYGAAGVKISSDGTVTPSYDTVKTQLENDKKTREAEIQNSDGKTTKETYKAYADAKAVATSLDRGRIAYEAKENQIQAMDTSGINTEKEPAIVIEPKALDYVKYLSKEDQAKPNKEELAKETSHYKTDLEARQTKCDNYNNLQKEKEAILDGLTDKDGTKITSKEQLDKAVTDAKAKVEELGKTKIDSAKSTTCSQHDAAIELIDNQIAALGDKTSFEKAVKEIKDMNDALKDALKVQKEEQDVTEADNAVKNTKKTGNIFKRLFTKRSQANKEARADRKVQIQERNDAYAAFLEKYTR